jgi:hypothetical protein
VTITPTARPGPARAACDAWVTRVLDVDISQSAALSRSAARGRAAAELNTRGIAFPKLLLRWRSAQASLAASLDQVAKTVLSKPEIKADPNFDQIAACASQLPTFVPRFGTALEDAIDEGINAGQGPQAQEIARRAVSIIDQYRAQIAEMTELTDLEEFVKDDLGLRVPLGADLDAALTELRDELSTTA